MPGLYIKTFLIGDITMSESAVLTQRPESSPVSLAVQQILAALAEAQRMASGVGQETAITSRESQPVSPQREVRRRMRWRGID